MYNFIFSCRLSQNLLEKAAERETRQEYALAMIQCKVLKQLENLEQQKYDDEDITEDIKFLLERLGESVQDLRYSEDASVWLTLQIHDMQIKLIMSLVEALWFCCNIFTDSGDCDVYNSRVCWISLTMPCAFFLNSTAHLTSTVLNSSLAAWNGVLCTSQRSSGVRTPFASMRRIMNFSSKVPPDVFSRLFFLLIAF